ncbi:UNVERIFIED_CONTAM: NADH-ubiquinone oxidoreductase chain 5 [Trichonephila clavipes]
MYLIILFLPIFGSIAGGLLGRKVGTTGAHIITTTSLLISALLCLVLFYEVVLNGYSLTIYLDSWIDSEILDVSWDFLFDSLTVSMLFPVLIVSALVHVFSIEYIGADPHNQRFFSYLSMFTFFMLILVAGNNYLIIFVGWEGIGISSYLLINFWFTRIQANKSAIKALVVNRVGDMFLSVGFFVIFFALGNLDYSTVFTLAPSVNETVVTTIGILLLLAAMGKSAQFGLHVWLPDAMEVSALIHAATLVTAGVYLLMRSSPLIEYGPTALIAITWVGAITAFFAASTGLLQNDLKRVIAYSTCSQMGYLFIACGLSQYNVALFHLVNHAFFKALLFLAAGAVLHATYDQQDQRNLGGLIGFLPFTYVAILIGSLSLIAVPWMTGFYSKDLILEVAYGQYDFTGHLAYWIGSISACLTAFYSLRLISLTFITYPNANKSTYIHTHDAPFVFVMIPLTILSLFAIFFGYVARDVYVGIGSDAFSSSLFTYPTNITLIEAEFGLPHFQPLGFEMGIKMLPAILTFSGAILAIYLYHKQPLFTVELTDNSTLRKVYRFFNGKYYIDVIYNHYFMYGGLRIGYNISKEIDRGAIELIGPKGLSKSLGTGSSLIGQLDTGNLTDYALYIGVGIVTITGIIFSVNVLGIENNTMKIVFILLSVLVIINSTRLRNTSVLIKVIIKQRFPLFDYERKYKKA